MKRAQKATDVNRRHFLAAGVAIVSGAGIAAANSAADGPEGRQPVSSAFRPDLTADELVNGSVVEVGASELRVSDASRSRIVTVAPANGAAIVRDGPVALSQFAVGDEIAAQGTWDAAGTFHARAIAPMFSTAVGTVVERRGNRLETDQGPIDVSSRTVTRGGHAGEDEGGIHFKEERPSAIGAGEGVLAYGFHPGGGEELLAVSIGVTGK